MQKRSVTTAPEMHEHVPLAPYTTLVLGGPARYLAECRSEVEVRTALGWAAEQRLPVLILGGGSNVVIPDSGYPGLVLRMAMSGIEFRDCPGPEVVVEAGASWDRVVAAAVTRGWAGIECLSGIPGTVGATPIQNVGAYGQEVSTSIRRVSCLDRITMESVQFSAEECDFGYRSSRFKGRDRGRYLILSVSLVLERDGAPALIYPQLSDAVNRSAPLEGLSPAEALDRVRETVINLRRSKSMVLDPDDPESRSAGSFFLNPVISTPDFAELEMRWVASGGSQPIPAYPADDGIKISAAWLVEQAGFSKGYQLGGVAISRNHALALVNHGGTSVELLELAARIADGVERRFGIRLTPEPEIVTAPDEPGTGSDA